MQTSTAEEKGGIQLTRRQWLGLVAAGLAETARSGGDIAHLAEFMTNLFPNKGTSLSIGQASSTIEEPNTTEKTPAERAQAALNGGSPHDTAILRAYIDPWMKNLGKPIKELITLNEATLAIQEYRQHIEANTKLWEQVEIYSQKVLPVINRFNQKTLDPSMFTDKKIPIITIEDLKRRLVFDWKDISGLHPDPGGGWGPVDGNAVLFGPYEKEGFDAEAVKKMLTLNITHELVLHTILQPAAGVSWNTSTEIIHPFMGMHEWIACQALGISDFAPVVLLEAWKIMARGKASWNDIVTATARIAVGTEWLTYADFLKKAYVKGALQTDPIFEDLLFRGELPLKLITASEVSEYQKYPVAKASLKDALPYSGEPYGYLIPQITGWGPNGELTAGGFDINISNPDKIEEIRHELGDLSPAFLQKPDGDRFISTWMIRTAGKDFFEKIREQRVLAGRPKETTRDEWVRWLEKISPKATIVWLDFEKGSRLPEAKANTKTFIPDTLALKRAEVNPDFAATHKKIIWIERGTDTIFPMNQANNQKTQWYSQMISPGKYENWAVVASTPDINSPGPINSVPYLNAPDPFNKFGNPPLGKWQ